MIQANSTGQAGYTTVNRPAQRTCGNEGPSDGYKPGDQGFCGTTYTPSTIKATCPQPVSSPEVRGAIDLVSGGQLTNVVKARGMPRTDWHRPEAPAPFASVETHMTFEADGQKAEIGFSTGLGHLTRVTPGETKTPNGAITVRYNGGEPQELNNREIDSLLGNIYGRFSGQMTQQNANDFSHVINMAMAVRHQDGSPEQVAAQHQQFSQNRIHQPEICFPFGQ